MMLRPARIETVSHLHALGNTPAVSLTQSIPPFQDATLLLLGCGDARNVLFTAYSRQPSDKAKLDLTCCDIQAEIIGTALRAP